MSTTLSHSTPFLVPFASLLSGWNTITISGQVDRASATETVDSGSIPGRVKPKTIIIGIYSFPSTSATQG